MTNWKSALTKLKEHPSGKCELHQNSLQSATELKLLMEGQRRGIDIEISVQIKSQVAKNRDILKSIAKTVLLAGRQNLALRGHRTTHPIMTNQTRVIFKPY